MRMILFYEPEQFEQFREEKLDEGTLISSISKWSSAETIASSFFDQIVDISSIVFNLNTNKGLLFEIERLISVFPDGTLFIADRMHEQAVRYDFRFCFDDFDYIQLKDTDKLLTKRTESEIDEQGVRKNKIVDLESTELEDFFKEFNSRLYGHQKFKDEFRELVRTFRIFNAIGEHKVLSLFLMGDSGVGKTEVARVIKRCLKGNKKIAKVNFGNYSSKDALNSLIGSPRGYIGSETGELFEKVKSSDIGLILIDEFEKADSAVFNYFLEVLETGRMTNSQGAEIDVNGYIIIFTSNVTKEEFKERISPELRSRFNFKVHFSLLFDQDKEKFVQFRLSEILAKYDEHFSISLPHDAFASIIRQIKVSEFKNMRDLNHKIKETFVRYVTSEAYLKIEGHD